ncbi:arginine esterase-like [Silurus asotus]|uniref:Arginine esterase-like n=1 Tax=Silurus asotus TaxID=30991 RepID=A0AAD5ATY6_SILAS|nr:arginine esterase-like [Silurus asotus]
MKTLHALLFAAALGVVGFHAAHGEEIIHGKKASMNSYQYMVSVQSESEHICGGFLIDPGYVLTAAHCYVRSHVSVVMGTRNIDWKTNHMRRYQVTAMYIHPSYRGHPKFGSDIMLLKLSGKVNLNNRDLKIIKIPSMSHAVDPNIKCEVAGWGRTEYQLRVNDLMVAQVPIINMTDCKKSWNALHISLPHNILCAGGYRTTSGACQGDSGGPLVCSGVAVGIVSFNRGRNCDYPDVPNVYTEIAPYVDWINSVIKQNA